MASLLDILASSQQNRPKSLVDFNLTPELQARLQQLAYSMELDRIKAQEDAHRQMVEQRGLLGQIGAQIAPGGGDLISGTGRLVQGTAGMYGDIERLFGGDGYSAFQDSANQFADYTNSISRDTREAAADEYGNLNQLQETAGAFGNMLPSMGVSAGIGALTGGTGFLGTLFNVPAMGYRALSDAYGEAAAVEQDLIKQGASLEEARRQADWTKLTNIPLNAATEYLGGKFAKAGSMLPGVAGYLGAGLGQGLIEDIQEPTQNVISQAAYKLNPNGQPTSFMEFMNNLRASAKENWVDEFTQLAGPMLAATTLTGGVGQGFDVANQRAAARDRDAYIGELKNYYNKVDDANELQGIIGQLNPIQGPQLPSEQDLGNLWQEAMDTNLWGADIAPRQRQVDMTNAQEPQRPEVIPENMSPQELLEYRKSLVQNGLWEQLGQQQNATSPEEQAVQEMVPERAQTRREQAFAWAEKELERLTDNSSAIYDEEGELVNPLEQENMRRYATIAKAMQQGDIATLEQLRGAPETRELSQPNVRSLDQQDIYTGGPTKFEGRFDSAFLGSGQGAHVHGMGHYGSASGKVGNMYRIRYSKPTGVESINGQPATENERAVIDSLVPWNTFGKKDSIRYTNKLTDRETLQHFLKYKGTSRDINEQQVELGGILLEAGSTLATILNIANNRSRLYKEPISETLVPLIKQYRKSKEITAAEAKMLTKSIGSAKFTPFEDNIDYTDKPVTYTNSKGESVTVPAEEVAAIRKRLLDPKLHVKFENDGQLYKIGIPDSDQLLNSRDNVSLADNPEHILDKLKAYRDSKSPLTRAKEVDEKTLFVNGEPLVDVYERTGQGHSGAVDYLYDLLQNNDIDWSDIDDMQQVIDILESDAEMLDNYIAFALDPANTHIKEQDILEASNKQRDMDAAITAIKDGEVTLDTRINKPLFVHKGHAIYDFSDAYDPGIALLQNWVANIKVRKGQAAVDKLTLNDFKDMISDEQAIWPTHIGLQSNASPAEYKEAIDHMNATKSLFRAVYSGEIELNSAIVAKPARAKVGNTPIFDDDIDSTTGSYRWEQLEASEKEVIRFMKQIGTYNLDTVLDELDARIMVIKHNAFRQRISPEALNDPYEPLNDLDMLREMMNSIESGQIKEGEVTTITHNVEDIRTIDDFVNSTVARNIIKDALTSDYIDSENIVHMLEAEAARHINYKDAEIAAVKVLKAAGIPGLVYTGERDWSGNKRGVDNFTIWDDDAIERKRTFFQKQALRIAESFDNTPTDIKDDSAVYKDVLKKLKRVGVTGAEAEANGKLYTRAFNNFGKLFGVDANTLWTSMNVDFKSEDLTLPDGTKRRGNIQLTRTGNNKSLIGVAITVDPKNRDVSTLFHEQGHFYTELLRAAALANPDNKQVQASWNAVKKFTGAKTDDLTTEQHEKMGNSFMNYVLKGEAPVAELKTVFQRFKAWLSNMWARLTGEQREEFSTEIKDVFNGILADDAVFDALYNPSNPRVANVINNPLTVRTQGNVTTVTKNIDRSDVINPIIDNIESPNIIAEKYKKFAPVYDLGVKARRDQDKMRAQYSHTIDKVFGKPNIFSRGDAIAKTDEDRAGINDALILGDMYGKELTDKELKDMGITDNAIKGYRRMRTIYNNLGRKINAQRAKYGQEAMELKAGYVPHIFHAFRVHDADGDIVQSFNTLNDAVKYAKSIAKNDRHITIRPAMNDFSGQARIDAITVGDTQYFMMLHKVSNVFALSMKDAKEFTADVARMANKSRTFLNAKFREGYAGYDIDMEYAARHYSNMASRYIAMDSFKHDARRYFERAFGKFDRGYKGIASYTKDYINDILGVPTAWEEAENKLIEDSGLAKWLPNEWQDRPSVALGQVVTGTTAQVKLGFLNMASGLINLSSLNGTAAITGYGRTTAAVNEYLSPNLTTKKLYTALQLGTDITMESASTYSSRSAEARSKFTRAFGKASGGFFSVMDMSARKISAIAAYRKAIADGKTQQQAYAYAREVVDKTNFNYGVEDSPNIFRRSGAAGAAALQFKKYSIKVAELGLHHLEGAQKAKYWAGQVVLAGVLGAIPGWNLIRAAIKALLPNEPDLELEIKRVIADLPLPAVVQRQLLYGAFSHLGIDISSRVGMRDILPDQASALVGPGVQTILDIVTKSPKLLDGWDGVTDYVGYIVPGFANPFKAAMGESRNRKTGTVDFSYEGVGERMARGLGFTPTREAVQRDAVTMANYEDTTLNQRKKDAIADYIKARLAGKSTTEERKRLNKLGVTPQAIVKALKDAQNTKDKYTRELATAKGARKEIRRQNLQEYRAMW